MWPYVIWGQYHPCPAPVTMNSNGPEAVTRNSQFPSTRNSVNSLPSTNHQESKARAQKQTPRIQTDEYRYTHGIIYGEEHCMII